MSLLDNCFTQLTTLWTQPLAISCPLTVSALECLILTICWSRSRSYFRTDSQSVSVSWNRAPLWDLQPDITSCRNVGLISMRSYIYWAPSLTRGRVRNLQCNHKMVRVAQNPKPYFTVSCETPATWRARFPYLYPPRTGWPSYHPGHWVPFTSSLTTRRATVEVF
jgi:hypothetical protein